MRMEHLQNKHVRSPLSIPHIATADLFSDGCIHLHSVCLSVSIKCQGQLVGLASDVSLYNKKLLQNYVFLGDL